MIVISAATAAAMIKNAETLVNSRVCSAITTCRRALATQARIGVVDQFTDALTDLVHHGFAGALLDDGKGFVPAALAENPYALRKLCKLLRHHCVQVGELALIAPNAA